MLLFYYQMENKQKNIYYIFCIYDILLMVSVMDKFKQFIIDNKLALIIIGVILTLSIITIILITIIKNSKKYIDEDTSKYETKYPVLLVHGMVLKNFKLYGSFRKIRNVLKDNNVNVYISNIDGIGGIENNAYQLKNEILEILKKENADKINLIAHSKGGLDSRYMITKLDMEDYVASLTTLSTPHHGSKLSRKLLTLPVFIQKIIAFFVDTFYKISKDKNPDIVLCGRQLSDENMKRFNENITNSDKVYYQSYSSSLSSNKMFVLRIPHYVMKKIENDSTDGLVSIDSSKWGEYKGEMPEGIDHAKMVGAYGTYSSLLQISKFYLNIVKELKEKNF